MAVVGDKFPVIDSRVHLRLEVHSELQVFMVMSFTFEVYENRCDLSILLDSDLMLLYLFPECPLCLTDLVFMVFGASDQMYDIA